MTRIEAGNPEFDTLMAHLRDELEVEQASHLAILTPHDSWKDIMHLRFPFDNFHVDLPGGSRRTKLYIERVGSSRSVERKGKTIVEFHEDIDRVIQEQGIPIDEILSLEEQMCSDTNSPTQAELISRGEKRLKLLELTLPVFAQLLLEGYTKHDLAG